jgi:hypothetical protein
MRFRCIRTIEAFPGQPGRQRFAVRCGIVIEPNEEESLLRYGAPALETLFNEANALAHLRSHEGITRAFDTVDKALVFVDQVKQAVDETPAYWRRADAFPGRDE